MSFLRPFRSLIYASVGLALLLSPAGLPTIASAATFEPAMRPQSTGPGRNVSLPRRAAEALTLPREALTLVDQLIPVCVEMANQATALNRGRPTTTGTLRMDAAGRMSYRAMPLDVLVLSDASGATSQLVITALKGDLSSAENFLAGDHVARCAVSARPTLDVQVASTRLGAQHMRQVRGTVQEDDTKLTLDLRLNSSQVTDSDTFASQYDDQVSGTMSTDDLRITVDERSEEQSFDLNSSTKSIVNSQWSEGATRYQFHSLSYTTAMTNGRPDISSYSAQGSVVTNDRAVGQAEMKVTSSTTTLLLVGASGRVTLKTWTR